MCYYTYEELLKNDHGSGGGVSKEFTAWCGLCYEWFQASADNKPQAERGFKSVGWRRTTKHGWLCSSCYEAYKKREK